MHLLAADPELADGLDHTSFGAAARALTTPSVRVSRGDTRLDLPGPPQLFGLLIVDGFLLRVVEVTGACSAELLGPGDVLRPGGLGEDELPGRATASWRALVDSRLAVIDRRLLARASEWPDVLAGLAARALKRTDELARQFAIGNRQRTDERLLFLFRQLARRFGRMTPDGVRMDLPLTHEVLALMVGAHRPSVTSALKTLDDRGQLTRLSHTSWLLPLSQPIDLGAQRTARQATNGTRGAEVLPLRLRADRGDVASAGGAS